MLAKFFSSRVLNNFSPRSLSSISVINFSSSSKSNIKLKKDDDHKDDDHKQKEKPKKSSKWLPNFLSTTPIETGSESHSNRLADHDVVYELQMHKVKPDCMQHYLEEFGNFVEMMKRWKTGGELMGSWIVEVGDLDEAIHIWKFKGGYKTLDKHKAILRQEEEFKKFRLKRNKYLRSRENQLMLAFSFWPQAKQRPGSNIYELRSYTLKPGTMINWGNSWAKGLKFRQTNQESMAGFFSHVGNLYQAHHLWAYESMADREEVRDTAWCRDGWAQCVSDTVPLVRHMISRILIPTPFSPFK